LHGQPESYLRAICEDNEKLFAKKANDTLGKITFKSLSSTEAKINVGNVYLWKNYIIEFEVS
jgi:hypothetical protein